MDAYNIYITRKYTTKIYTEYEQLRRRYPEQLPSLGEVVGWERTGTPIAETLLMRSLQLNDDQRLMLRWLDVVCEVLHQLKLSRGRARKTYDRQVMNVLRGRIIECMSLDGILREFFHRRVSVVYVSDLYEEGLKMIADEAVRHGLLPETSV